METVGEVISKIALKLGGLEAVFISTPPQWQDLQFIAVCEKWLDIFCEKPLSYDQIVNEYPVKSSVNTGE